MDMTAENDTVFRRRALTGWYQALNTRLLQRVEAAARKEGQARPNSKSRIFDRLAVAEAPDLYHQVKALQDRL
jgi:hypothetical protein